MTKDTITIKNGNKLREWTIFGITVISLLVGGAMVWSSLCNKVSNLEIETHRIVSTGTAVSQENARDIIMIKADVKYTRAAVDAIDHKMEKIYERVQ